MQFDIGAMQQQFKNTIGSFRFGIIIINSINHFQTNGNLFMSNRHLRASDDDNAVILAESLNQTMLTFLAYKVKLPSQLLFQPTHQPAKQPSSHQVEISL